MSATRVEYHNVFNYISESLSSARSLNPFRLLSPIRFVVFIFNIFYILIQKIIIWMFKPRPPKYPEQPTKPLGRIAVIGAGLTGISSAAHAIAHGFDVVIFEQDDRVGGIWTHVNKTSGLQLNSLLYRFHPAVLWSCAFPLRDEILSEVTRIWKEYQLEPRTRFKTPVTSIRPITHDENGNRVSDDPKLDPSQYGHRRWIINDGDDGVFDAVIVTVGTCGKPRMVEFEGMPKKKEESKKHKEEHDMQKHDEASREPTDGGSSQGDEGIEPQKHSAWTTTHNGQAQYIRQDQEQKKATNFPTPGDAHHHEGTQAPTHTHTSEPHKSGSAYKATAWTFGTYEPPKSVEHDQEAKKEAGFPSPQEVFPTSPSADPQLHTNKPRPVKHDGFPHHARKSKDTDEDVFTKGPIVHSSELDSLDEDAVKGKTVLVIGSGASGVESVETALAKGAKGTVMIAREDKWIIPRNILIDTLISAQPFGRQMPLSFIWEKFIIWFNYHGVSDLAPAHLGLFEGTPVVNDEFLDHVRRGKCQYVRGDTQRLTKRGVKVTVRGRESKPGDKGDINEIDADIIVLATGYEKPKVDLFKYVDLFPEGFERPNLYLQNFSTEDWSVLMTNSSYQNAIGTVHIGIYTRILLVLLMDKNARPTTDDMKLWVRLISYIKRGARGGAFGFFTYMELTIWLLLFHIFRPDRLKWLFFIMQGWGVTPDEYR
ncbi:unnamed protein product [Somion occarium]|uniref:Flavin-containing monooxygenase n=1 Tax=Somion occarium TaxID=3059160 RepID=A0ABP1D677_9APHY